MNSHNHPMFGSIGAWFYKALAGINPDPAKPGFERVVIAPQVVRDLKWASGSLDTIRGTVASSWSRSDNGLRLEVTHSRGQPGGSPHSGVGPGAGDTVGIRQRDLEGWQIPERAGGSYRRERE